MAARSKASRQLQELSKLTVGDMAVADPLRRTMLCNPMIDTEPSKLQ